MNERSDTPHEKSRLERLVEHEPVRLVDSDVTQPASGVLPIDQSQEFNRNEIARQLSDNGVPAAATKKLVARLLAELQPDEVIVRLECRTSRTSAVLFGGILLVLLALPCCLPLLIGLCFAGNIASMIAAAKIFGLMALGLGVPGVWMMKTGLGKSWELWAVTDRRLISVVSGNVKSYSFDFLNLRVRPDGSSVMYSPPFRTDLAQHICELDTFKHPRDMGRAIELGIRNAEARMRGSGTQ